MNVLNKDTLNEFLITDIETLMKFINNNFYSIIVFVENIEDLWKKSDNIIEDINLIFDNDNSNNIKISTIKFSEVNKIIELNLNSSNPLVIEVEDKEITSFIPIFDFEKLISLYEMNKLLITDISELKSIFKNEKNSILLLTDDLEDLSELLPEPIKNIQLLYEKFYNVNIKDMDINILYSDKKDLNNFLYSNDLEELPLPLLFKVDYTGTLSFPIRIKREYDNQDDNINYSEIMEKYEDILSNLI